LGRRWREQVNRPQTEAEALAIRRSIARGQPLGGAAWTAKIIRQLGLEHTLRPRGRPRKTVEKATSP
jgi:putative transposase